MPYPFSAEKAKRNLFKVAHITRVAYFSERDGCVVVGVVCSKCGHMFTEEFEAAVRSVLDGSRKLCLACDEDADVIAGVKVRVEGGWTRE